jgi:hypothetical protein
VGLVVDPVVVRVWGGSMVQGGAASATPEQKIVGKISGVQKTVHIIEEKAYTTLDDGGEQATCRWVLDTGASNHM